MKPIQLDIIALLPEGWGLCMSCERLMTAAQLEATPYTMGMNEFPPDWQKDIEKLSDWVSDLSFQYGSKINIRVIDPRSIHGILKSLQFFVRRYPTFIIQGQGKVTGFDMPHLEQMVQSAIASQHNIKDTNGTTYLER